MCFKKNDSSINYSYMSNFRLEKIRKKILKKFYLIRIFYIGFSTFYICLLFMFFINLLMGINNVRLLFTIYDLILIVTVMTLTCKIYNWYLKMKLKVFDIRIHYREKSPKLMLEYINHNMFSYTVMMLMIFSFIIVNIIFFLYLK